MFRDESLHVIKKAKAKARKRAALNDIAGSDDASSPDSDSDSPDFSKPTSFGRRSLSIMTGGLQSISAGKNDNLLPSPESGSWPETPGHINVLYTLAPTCQERGTAYFFSRYVTTNDNVCHQRFDFVYDVWKPGSPSSDRQVDGVLASMTAVGLVGLASTIKSTELQEAARKAYGTALRLTNCALKDPAEAARDTTLLSVLILGLFELITEHTPRTAKAFQEHVNGAAALAKLRGSSQFRTPAGIKMFLLLCQRITISCAQQEMPMPATLVNLRKELAKFMEPTDPTWRIAMPVYEVLQIRHEIKRQVLTSPEAIISRLLAVERDIEGVIEHFPTSWHYRPLQVTRRHPAILGDLCHMYPSMSHASTWNEVRTVRVLVLETIIAELHMDSQSSAPRLVSNGYKQVLHEAKEKLKSVVEAINASVPHQLGLLNNRGSHIENVTPATTPISCVEIRQTPSPPTSPASQAPSAVSHAKIHLSALAGEPQGPTLANPLRAKNGEDEARRFMLLASAPNALIWPLYMVGMSSACTGPMKGYVIERLRMLYMETSLKQADDVANLLEARHVSVEWPQPAVSKQATVTSLARSPWGLV